MALGTIDSEGKGVRRALDSEINMVPMIDLLVCCISFLLITAVWSHVARIDSSALVPGEVGVPPASLDRTLHVDAREEGKLTLTWRRGATVISTIEIAKPATPEVAERDLRYSDLGAKIRDEWGANGSHRDPSDRVFDQAVLHTSDKAPFREIVALLDAIHAPQRQAGAHAVAAFNVMFAAH